MRLSRKIVLISAAVLALAPAASTINPAASVQAAKRSSVHNTYGKNSRVKTIKSVHFVNANGKKLKRVAKKGGHYTIWNVKTINGATYFSIQTNLKLWLPATAVSGHVQYRLHGQTIKLTIKRGKLSQSSQSAAKKSKKKTVKKSTKKASKKTTKKSSKKTSKKTSKKSYKITLIRTVRRTHVVNSKGQNVKSYMGSKKNVIIGKNVNLRGLGTKQINGKKYYALTPNKFYISASDVKAR